ncbi:hypothetical protein Hanom_Chr12g01068111 [Helianthus anomalus]
MAEFINQHCSLERQTYHVVERCGKHSGLFFFVSSPRRCCWCSPSCSRGIGMRMRSIMMMMMCGGGAGIEIREGRFRREKT